MSTTLAASQPVAVGVVAQLVEHHNGIANPIAPPYFPGSCPCSQFLALLACLATSRTAAPSTTSPALRDAIAALLAAKQSAGCRPAYVRSLRQYLAQFARGREERPLGEITVADLEAWFAARAEAPATRASNAGRLSALWAFALRRGWVTDNPVRRLERVRVPAAAPRILTPEESGVVLARTRAARPGALAVVALGHSPRILARHYREVVTPEAAREFWALRP